MKDSTFDLRPALAKRKGYLAATKPMETPKKEPDMNPMRSSSLRLDFEGPDDDDNERAEAPHV